MNRKEKIYRVGGFYASGSNYYHLVAADTVRQAIDSVLEADPRMIRVTHVSRAYDVED